MPSPPLRAGLSPPHRLVDPLPRGGYYRPVSSGSNALRSHPRAPGEVFIGVSPPNVSVGTPGGLIPSHRGAIRPLTFVSAAAGSWRSLAPSSALLAAASGRPGCNTLRASRPPPGCNTLGAVATGLHPRGIRVAPTPIPGATRLQHLGEGQPRPRIPLR